MHQDTVIIIPARIGSVRLKNKPLCVIGNKTLIEHVYERACESGLRNIYVATDSNLIAERISRIGGKVIMTGEHCQSGTDRVFEALQKIDNNKDFKYVINLQGDMPFVKPQHIVKLVSTIKNTNVPLATLACTLDKNQAEKSSVVKLVTSKDGKALYFSRQSIPHGAEKFLCHIGIYAFTRSSLESFVKMPKSYLEEQEKLEQLRAMENNMDIYVSYVESMPISVDTPEDLNLAIDFYNNRAERID